MYGLEIDSIKLALQRYRTAYLDAEEQKKNATDNYKQELVWGVRANIERELGQKANEQAEKVHEATAKIMRQVGSGARAKGADLTEDYQLLQNPAFDLDEKDLESMIERNKNNSTMIRAIRGYLKQHHIALHTPSTEKDKLDAIRRIEVDVTSAMQNTAYIGQLNQMVDDFDNFFARQLAVLNGEHIAPPQKNQIEVDASQYDRNNAAYGVMESASPSFWDTHRPLY